MLLSESTPQASKRKPNGSLISVERFLQSVSPLQICISVTIILYRNSSINYCAGITVVTAAVLSIGVDVSGLIVGKSVEKLVDPSDVMLESDSSVQSVASVDKSS